MDRATTVITVNTATATPPRAKTKRDVLIPLERQAHRALLLVIALAVAGWLGGHIVRPPVAAYLATRATDVAGAERAVAWDPKSPDLHLRLARAYAQAGDHPRALASFDTALRLR